MGSNCGSNEAGPDHGVLESNKSSHVVSAYCESMISTCLCISLMPHRCTSIDGRRSARITQEVCTRHLAVGPACVQVEMNFGRERLRFYSALHVGNFPVAWSSKLPRAQQSCKGIINVGLSDVNEYVRDQPKRSKSGDRNIDLRFAVMHCRHATSFYLTVLHLAG
jgi:hypothetical protein